MTIEQAEVARRVPEDLEELEKLLVVKEPRLPKSIRRYIRELKRLGRWEEAMGVRQEELRKAVEKRGYKTKEERAREELDRTIKRLLETDDPKLQAEDEVRAVWLLNLSGRLDQEERIEDILDILDSKAPELKDYLEGRLAEIRDRTLKV